MLFLFFVSYMLLLYHIWYYANSCCTTLCSRKATTCCTNCCIWSSPALHSTAQNSGQALCCCYYCYLCLILSYYTVDYASSRCTALPLNVVKQGMVRHRTSSASQYILLQHLIHLLFICMQNADEAAAECCRRGGKTCTLRMWHESGCFRYV